MAGLELDFVMYLGDPDEGAEAVDSRALVQDLERFKEQIDRDGPYGALVASIDGKPALSPRPDPALSLITHLLKAVPYVLEGEQESFLLSESEHGITMAGGADDVVVSFFAGDMFEPDEYLLPQTSMSLAAFGDQVVGMGKRMQSIVETAAPELLEADSSLLEFLDVANDAVKKYKLEVDRGLRGA